LEQNTSTINAFFLGSTWNKQKSISELQTKPLVELQFNLLANHG